MSEMFNPTSYSKDASAPNFPFTRSSSAIEGFPRTQLMDYSPEITKDELLLTLNEYKRANVELAKDRKYLRLHSQSREEHASKLQVELESTMSEMNKLKDRVKALELDDSHKNGNVGHASNQGSNSSHSDNIPKQELLIRFEEDESKLAEARYNDPKNDASDTEHVYDLIGCQCGAAVKLEEVMQINHCWHKDYTRLFAECERLKKTEKQLSKLGKDFEEVKKIAFQKAEECRNEHERNVALSEGCNADEMEALKQQVKIYQEDFMQEKDDCNKLIMENCALKESLQKANETIRNMTGKSNGLKEKYRQVYMEKDNIVKELKRLTNTTADRSSGINHPQSPQPQPQLPRGELAGQDGISHKARIVVPPPINYYNRPPR